MLPRSPCLPLRLRTLLLAALAGAVSLLPERSGAIVNGTPAELDEFPGIAALVTKGSFGFIPLLGGAVVVGNQWVVTAAHSVVDRPASTLQIWTGITDLEDPQGRIAADVLRVVVHPDYDQGGGSSSSDIALLLLDRPLFSAPVAQIADENDPVSEGDLGAVAGWGTTEPGFAQPSPVLLRAAAAIVENSFADSFFSGEVVDETHLAARDPDEIQSPCVGDSGGPLVLPIPGEGDAPATAKLVGLVSFGVLDCGNATVPTVYTSVPFFANWIRNHLALTETPPGSAVFGRNRRIRSGRNATRRADSTDFGRIRSNRFRTRRFQLRNLGGGILTVQNATVTGRAFSIRRPPAPLIDPGGVTVFSVELRSRRGVRRHNGRVRILTNHPSQPVYVFRVGARTPR